MSTLYKHLTVEIANRIAIVRLNRSEVHNALNLQLIGEMSAAFDDIGRRDEVRAILLSGEGPSFCAGGDLNWMRSTIEYSHEENVADSENLANMYEAINTCSKPVIGRIHGSVFGGGIGLVAVCDIAVAADSSVFALSEAKLGLAPSIISPYVIRKIGETHARALFITAERFNAARALQIGLVHQVAAEEHLDSAVQAIVKQILANGPQAVSESKRLAMNAGYLPKDEARKMTVETIAHLRASQEGQEGMKAFLEKRKPSWIEGEH